MPESALCPKRSCFVQNGAEATTGGGSHREVKRKGDKEQRTERAERA